MTYSRTSSVWLYVSSSENDMRISGYLSDFTDFIAMLLCRILHTAISSLHGRGNRKAFQPKRTQISFQTKLYQSLGRLRRQHIWNVIYVSTTHSHAIAMASTLRQHQLGSVSASVARAILALHASHLQYAVFDPNPCVRSRPVSTTKFGSTSHPVSHHVHPKGISVSWAEFLEPPDLRLGRNYLEAEHG